MPPFAGFRLVIADHALGLPCVHAVATTPAQRLGVLFALLHTAGSAAGPAHETHWRVSERWLDQSRVEVFLQAMQQLGWSDSRNVRLDIRWGAGNPETNGKRAEEMVALAPAIIVAFGSSAVAALLQATRSVPVVFAGVVDPVSAGYVASLARPGGNATGFLCLNT